MTNTLEIKKIYADQEYFIWGEVLCKAVGIVRASATELVGNKAEILILAPSCSRRDALRVCSTFSADTTFLEVDEQATGLVSGPRDVLIRGDRFAPRTEVLPEKEGFSPKTTDTYRH